MKQRITAIAAKVRRYQGQVAVDKTDYLKRIKSSFIGNQEEERCGYDQPVAEEQKQFWGNIWRQSADHMKNAKWLQDLRTEVNVKKVENTYYHRKFEKDTL